ncbi:MAG: hypothetical protein O2890_13025, partial [Cyanobacteria bacterium]|nr:hypothetical protein [Cyanobacteriota bacterium]
MSELSQSLSNLLPSQVTLTAVTPNLAAGGPGVGDRSYFDVQISDDSGILSGAVDAFCIDTDFPLSYEAFDLDNDGVYGESGVTVPNLSQALGLPNSTTYSEGTPQPFTASVYSSYDQTVLSDGLGGIIEKPENLDLVNWLLNDPNGQLAGYTTAEIQVAIWTLMDTPQLTADTTTGLNVFFGGFDQANVDAIVALAQSEGEGFVPGPGQKVAIILVPDGNSTGADGADTDPDGQPDGRPDAQIIITAVELAKLGDFVFEDSDADGLQDAGETGIAGVTVNLLADVDGDGTIEADEVVDSTTTDANGEYHFTVLPGDYQVQFETPDGYMASPGNQGGDDTTDSDGPLSDVASLDPGEVDTSIDAGFFRKAGL